MDFARIPITYLSHSGSTSKLLIWLALYPEVADADSINAMPTFSCRSPGLFVFGAIFADNMAGKVLLSSSQAELILFYKVTDILSDNFRRLHSSPLRSPILPPMIIVMHCRGWNVGRISLGESRDSFLTACTRMSET